MMLSGDLLCRLPRDLYRDIWISIFLVTFNLHALIEIWNFLRTIEILSGLVHLALLYLR
jgi:hypothetical protein